MILKVSASGYLPHLPFFDIGPLGLHEAICTLEFQLHQHWLVLELLVGGVPVAENLSQLQFGKWLVALPALGDHAAPLPILDISSTPNSAKKNPSMTSKPEDICSKFPFKKITK